MKEIMSFLGTTLLLLIFSTASNANEDPTKSVLNKMPENVKVIVEKSCYGCHNTDSKNEDAKEELDFKQMNKLSDFKKISAYKKIGETVEENEMPPKKILDKKPHMKLSQEEKETLINWAKKEAETLVKKK